jgi:hypothetical protein
VFEVLHPLNNFFKNCTPNFVAAEVEADLVLCALKIEVSIPAKRNTVLIHLAMVSVETLSLPRYTATWDVNLVLNSYEIFSLKYLTYKLVTLLALCTGQRCQTLSVLELNNTEISGFQTLKLY